MENLRLCQHDLESFLHFDEFTADPRFGLLHSCLENRIISESKSLRAPPPPPAISARFEGQKPEQQQQLNFLTRTPTEVTCALFFFLIQQIQNRPPFKVSSLVLKHGITLLKIPKRSHQNRRAFHHWSTTSVSAAAPPPTAEFV